MLVTGKKIYLFSNFFMLFFFYMKIRLDEFDHL